MIRRHLQRFNAWLQAQDEPQPAREIPMRHPAVMGQISREIRLLPEIGQPITPEAMTVMSELMDTPPPETRWRTVTTDWDHIDRIGDM